MCGNVRGMCGECAGVVVWQMTPPVPPYGQITGKCQVRDLATHAFKVAVTQQRTFVRPSLEEAKTLGGAQIDKK
eukprot:gene16112-biopygen6730